MLRPLVWLKFSSVSWLHGKRVGVEAHLVHLAALRADLHGVGGELVFGLPQHRVAVEVDDAVLPVVGQRVADTLEVAPENLHLGVGVEDGARGGLAGAGLDADERIGGHVQRVFLAADVAHHRPAAVELGAAQGAPVFASVAAQHVRLSFLGNQARRGPLATP